MKEANLPPTKGLLGNILTVFKKKNQQPEEHYKQASDQFTKIIDENLVGDAKLLRPTIIFDQSANKAGQQHEEDISVIKQQLNNLQESISQLKTKNFEFAVLTKQIQQLYENQQELQQQLGQYQTQQINTQVMQTVVKNGATLEDKAQQYSLEDTATVNQHNTASDLQMTCLNTVKEDIQKSEDQMLQNDFESIRVPENATNEQLSDKIDSDEDLQQTIVLNQNSLDQQLQNEQQNIIMAQEQNQPSIKQTQVKEQEQNQVQLLKTDNKLGFGGNNLASQQSNEIQGFKQPVFQIQQNQQQQIDKNANQAQFNTLQPVQQQPQPIKPFQFNFGSNQQGGGFQFSQPQQPPQNQPQQQFSFNQPQASANQHQQSPKPAGQFGFQQPKPNLKNQLVSNIQKQFKQQTTMNFDDDKVKIQPKRGK